MWLSGLRTPLVSMQMWFGLTQWVRDLALPPRLQHGLGVCLGSGLAVAVVYVGGCSSNSTPTLGTSICYRCSPKKTKKKKKKAFSGVRYA